MREYFRVLRQNKQNAKVLPDFDDVEEYEYDEDEEVGNGSQKGRRKFQAQPSKKKKGVKGHMDMFFTPSPEQVVKNRKDGKMKQSTINKICKKDLRDKACKELVNWFYDVGLPFNAVNHDSFRIAMEAVTQHGTSFKPPSYHKVRVPYLAKAIKSTDEMVQQMVEEIREQNVVQVVTDNASNYKAADSKSKTNAKVGNDVKWLIYNRTGVVNMMRKFTRKRELLRPATTRFATAYITLRLIQVQKINLRKMFTSDTWKKSKYAKEQSDKHVASILAMPTFWSNIVYILKLTGPIVSVLRLVDGEKKPAMCYIYQAMKKAKEAISSSFNDDENKYRDVFAIINKRWECQLHHPLHATGYYLNPQFYYSDPNIEEDPEVSSGMYQCVMRLVPNEDDQSKLTAEKKMYRNVEVCIGMRKVLWAEWWSSYGNEVHVLKKFAIKVLSLTCSATGCERNWSIFSLKRFDLRDLIDPLLLNEIDESNEWLFGRMYEDEPPMNDQSNVDDLNYNIRSNDVYASSSLRGRGRIWSSSRLNLMDVDDEVIVLENSDTEEEDVKEDESDHNEEGYTFDDDDDDDDADDDDDDDDDDGEFGYLD
ncbi:3-hydroxyisobutyryl-CoA hydrolase 1-like protein [Tanacetum coccineum]